MLHMDIYTNSTAWHHPCIHVASQIWEFSLETSDDCDDYEDCLYISLLIFLCCLKMMFYYNNLISFIYTCMLNCIWSQVINKCPWSGFYFLDYLYIIHYIRIRAHLFVNFALYKYLIIIIIIIVCWVIQCYVQYWFCYQMSLYAGIIILLQHKTHKTYQTDALGPSSVWRLHVFQYIISCYSFLQSVHIFGERLYFLSHAVLTICSTQMICIYK